MSMVRRPCPIETGLVGEQSYSQGSGVFLGEGLQGGEVGLLENIDAGGHVTFAIGLGVLRIELRG